LENDENNSHENWQNLKKKRLKNSKKVGIKIGIMWKNMD